MELIQKYYYRLRFTLKREAAGILVILLIFLIFPYLIREIDMTAAPIDPGIISVIILTVSSVLIFKAATWWIIKTIWPVFSAYSDHHFEQNFRSLIPWQKVVIYLGFYLLLLFAFVLVLAALV